ncbi:PLP-dependent aminotransferase family protein [Acidaminococcus intestini]|uniref:aminotransferase-like domain-containing protein n=1 Tax=Acidaminococcus intestini TaxID=187327 RepID=UPI002F95E2EF
MSINSFDNYYMSWKPQLNRTNQPLYISLARQLENDIATGVLLPGTKLPPQRELADFLDINVSTVVRAFKLCSNKGLLTSTVGSGTYVAYDVVTNIIDTPAKKKPYLIDMGSLTPETIPQDEVVTLLEKMIQEDDFGRLLQYNHSAMLFHKEAAVKLLDRAGCHTDADHVLFASGGQNATYAVLAGLFRPGDRIGTAPTVYPGLKSAAKLIGIHLVPIRQENNEFTAEAIQYAYHNEGITGLYVMPDYQNPTTHSMPLSCRKMIARLARDLDLLVIEDGINCLLSPHIHQSIANMAPEQTIFLASLSKTLIPALRLAYIKAPKKYFKNLRNALYAIQLSPSALLMELASRMIVSEKFEGLLERRRQGLKIRNGIVDEILKGYDVRGTEECLHRWLILSEDMSGEQFEHLALEHGVYVYGSQRFAVGKDMPVHAARLGICVPSTYDELREGLKILRQLL